MEKTYWLSYDLGVGGDYENLYQWLDDHKAKPCGNGTAFFSYDFPDNSDGDETLKSELLDKVKTKPGNILYLVRMNKDQNIVGSFLYGKRQAAPWVGYGSSTMQEIDK